jgi:hypothetical protein
MADTSNTPGTPNRLAALQSRLDQLHRDIAGERKRASRMSVLTVVLGLAILGLLGFYFYYGYTEFKSVRDPEMLVTYVDQEVVTSARLDEARQAMERQIKTSAPEIAGQLSKTVQTEFPRLVDKVIDLFIEEMEQSVQEATVVSEQHFRAYLRANKSLIDTKFKELAAGPTLAKESLAELEAPLEAELESEMKIDAAGLSRDIAAITANLKYLMDEKNSKKLTHDQMVELKVWMIARAIYLEALSNVKDSPLMQEK